jgi:hypothetical protein
MVRRPTSGLRTAAIDEHSPRPSRLPANLSSATAPAGRTPSTTSFHCWRPAKPPQPDASAAVPWLNTENAAEFRVCNEFDSETAKDLHNQHWRRLGNTKNLSL